MRRLRGFTLVEILVCLSLLALLASLSLLGLQGRNSRFSSRALAEILVEELRRARQSAITEQIPVAVGLPTANGTLPTSQSLYVATGQSMAHVSRILDFSGSHSGQVLFCGVLGPSDISFPLHPGGQREGFQPQNWLNNPNLSSNPLTNDYCLIFTPDGAVTSNGLPLHQGAYHLMVASGLTFGATAAPPSQDGTTSRLAYFEPLTAGSPRYVEVTRAGVVHQVDHLVPALSQTEEPMPATAPARSVTPLPALNPAAAAIHILPKPSLAIPGVNVTMVAGQRVTLAVNATEPGGHDLYLEWTAQRQSSNVSPSNGTFSHNGPQRMRWDASQGVWTGQWDWECPLDASPDDKFDFSCQLGDGTGQVVAGPTGPTILSIPSTPQVFYSCCAVPERTLLPCQIVQANADGSFPRPKVSFLSDWADEFCINRQGTLVYNYDGRIFSTISGQQVGTHQKMGWSTPAVSGDGKWAASDGPDPLGDLSSVFVHPANSSANTTLIPMRTPKVANSNWPTGQVYGGANLYFHNAFEWSRESRYLACTSFDGVHILEMSDLGSSVALVSDRPIPATLGGGPRLLAWKPDSSAFFLSDDAIGGGNICLVDTATLTPTALPQLDPFSRILIDGVHGNTPQPPASDGSVFWGCQAVLSPAGDRLYIIDSNGILTTADTTTGRMQGWSHVPPGVQSMRLAAP